MIDAKRKVYSYLKKENVSRQQIRKIWKYVKDKDIIEDEISILNNVSLEIIMLYFTTYREDEWVLKFLTNAYLKEDDEAVISNCMYQIHMADKKRQYDVYLASIIDYIRTNKKYYNWIIEEDDYRIRKLLIDLFKEFDWSPKKNNLSDDVYLYLRSVEDNESLIILLNACHNPQLRNLLSLQLIMESGIVEVEKEMYLALNNPEIRNNEYYLNLIKNARNFSSKAVRVVRLACEDSLIRKNATYLTYIASNPTPECLVEIRALSEYEKDLQERTLNYLPSYDEDVLEERNMTRRRVMEKFEELTY